MINEDGKVYWAIVKHGTENYPQSNPDLDEEAQALDKKLQIKGGMYALKSGSFNAKQDAVASFNMSGLDAETAYDIYFVAEDTAGNLSEIATILNVKTLDSSAPELVELRFSQANDEDIPTSPLYSARTFTAARHKCPCPKCLPPAKTTLRLPAIKTRPRSSG